MYLRKRINKNYGRKSRSGCSNINGSADSPEKTRAKPNNGESCYQTHIISLAFKLGFTQERVMGLVRVVVL